MTSGGVWKTPKPRAGISTPLFKVRFMVAGSFTSVLDGSAAGRGAVMSSRIMAS